MTSKQALRVELVTSFTLAIIILMSTIGLLSVAFAAASQGIETEVSTIGASLQTPAIPLYAGTYSVESHCGDVFRRWYVIDSPVAANATMLHQAKAINGEFKYSTSYRRNEDGLYAIWFRVSSY